MDARCRDILKLGHRRNGMVDVVVVIAAAESLLLSDRSWTCLMSVMGSDACSVVLCKAPIIGSITRTETWTPVLQRSNVTCYSHLPTLQQQHQGNL